jgi:di- and tripeptidase
VLSPCAGSEAGDIFALVWVPYSHTPFLGCQNTSLQLLDCAALPSDAPPAPAPRRSKVHKVFDSYPQHERRPADAHAANAPQPLDANGCVAEGKARADAPPARAPDIPAENVRDSAHVGYVFCMVPLPSMRDGADEHGGGRFAGHLLTGSGDETLKLWNTSGGLELVHTFEVGRGAVLAVVARGETAYAGCQDGYVTVWDLDTKTLVRAIIVQEVRVLLRARGRKILTDVQNVAILSLSLLHSDLYVTSEDGHVQARPCSGLSSDHADRALAPLLRLRADRILAGTRRHHLGLYRSADQQPVLRPGHLWE